MPQPRRFVRVSWRLAPGSRTCVSWSRRAGAYACMAECIRGALSSLADWASAADRWFYSSGGSQYVYVAQLISHMITYPKQQSTTCNTMVMIFGFRRTCIAYASVNMVGLQVIQQLGSLATLTWTMRCFIQIDHLRETQARTLRRHHSVRGLHSYSVGLGSCV